MHPFTDMMTGRASGSRRPEPVTSMSPWAMMVPGPTTYEEPVSFTSPSTYTVPWSSSLMEPVISRSPVMCTGPSW